MTRPLHFLLVLGVAVVAACVDPTSVREEADAAVPSPDSPPQPITGCMGESFELHGALTLVTASASTITVAGKVAGVSGSAGSGRLYTLNVRPWEMIDGIGTYDIATLNMQYLDQPSGGCSNGPCNGFYALSGTIEVTAMLPMYRANFTLRDLRERVDAGSSPGAPMAGEITGCVSAFN